MLPNVNGIEVSKASQSATITMDRHIPITSFQNTLEKKYSITEIEHNETADFPLLERQNTVGSWLATYKPILLVFGYTVAISVIVATYQNTFHWMLAMNVFMAGFFLTFSFFKMLDLKGFAESYSMYDIVARKTKVWGYIYPFIELALGIAYAFNFQPLFTNIVTLFIMGISIIGVLQSVLNKRTIKCACLGAVFNLPMSTVTIVEDGLMILMSGFVIISSFF